ncbi:MAG: usg protein [Rhodospirillaceae bacterium]
MSELALQLQNYRLTTAQILYFMPDHPSVLQEFIWQQMDLAPKFPELHAFLDFWNAKLDAKLHSVRVAHCELVKPAELQTLDGKLVLH